MGCLLNKVFEAGSSHGLFTEQGLGKIMIDYTTGEPSIVPS